MIQHYIKYGYDTIGMEAFYKTSPLTAEYIGGVVFLFLMTSTLYLGISSISYYYQFVLYREYYIPDLEIEKCEIKREIKTSMINIVGQALLNSAVQMLQARYGKTYYRIDDYGWPYLLVSSFALFCIIETNAYWSHRLLHNIPMLYRQLHKVHHSFVVVSPYCGLAFHPIDAFIQGAGPLLASFILPVHDVVNTVLLLATVTWAISIHDHIPQLPCKLFLYAPHHTLHHDADRETNFGQFTTIWDRACGTYVDPDHVYFGSKAEQPRATYQFKTRSAYIPYQPSTKKLRVRNKAKME